MSGGFGLQPIKEECFIVSEPNVPFTAFINRGPSVKIHWHTYIEMLYVISGSAIITIDSEKFHAGAGDFLIINSHEAHASEYFDHIPTEILVIQFEPTVINPALGSVFESGYMVPFLQKEVRYSKYIKLPDNSGLKTLLIEILDEFAGKNPGYELCVKGNIYKAFSWLIRNSHITLPRDNSFKTSDLLRLKDLMEYIESNYHEEISNETASRLACMSYHHFCRYFKKATGRTFIEYLNYIRLCEAEKLLLTTCKSISEIALKVGFPSVSYFNRLFRKEKGLAPLAFKKQNTPSIKAK